jgi:hypothetical protein
VRFRASFGVAKGGTLEVSLQGGNVWLPISLVTSLCCSKMRFSLKDFRADVWSRDRTYGLS